MRDAIGGLIGRYDQLGRYLDRSAIDSIETYLDESSLRIQAVELINREAAEIVREASQRLFRDEPELLLPGGNAYTTRRLAACLRDMDYFLRYASYALVAADSTILNERVLNGLDDIGVTLEDADTIRAYEESRRKTAPWLFNTGN